MNQSGLFACACRLQHNNQTSCPGTSIKSPRPSRCHDWGVSNRARLSIAQRLYYAHTGVTLSSPLAINCFRPSRHAGRHIRQLSYIFKPKSVVPNIRDGPVVQLDASQSVGTEAMWMSKLSTHPDPAIDVLHQRSKDSRSSAAHFLQSCSPAPLHGRTKSRSYLRKTRNVATPPVTLINCYPRSLGLHTYVVINLQHQHAWRTKVPTTHYRQSPLPEPAARSASFFASRRRKLKGFVRWTSLAAA